MPPTAAITPVLGGPSPSGSSASNSSTVPVTDRLVSAKAIDEREKRSSRGREGEGGRPMHFAGAASAFQTRRASCLTYTRPQRIEEEEPASLTRRSRLLEEEESAPRLAEQEEPGPGVVDEEDPDVRRGKKKMAPCVEGPGSRTPTEGSGLRGRAGDGTTSRTPWVTRGARATGWRREQGLTRPGSCWGACSTS